MRFGGHTPFIGRTEMHASDVGEIGQVRLELDDTVDVQQSFLEHLVLGIQQPLFPFGMRGADGPVKGREEDQPGFM
jgi:hypothetical protein